jgi:hypothetical protein
MFSKILLVLVVFAASTLSLMIQLGKRGIGCRMVGGQARWLAMTSESVDLSGVAVTGTGGLFASQVPFEDVGLSEPLIQALSKLNFTMATPIQQMSYSAVRSGKDVVMGSETGSGKTLSYLLPLVDQLLAAEGEPSPYFPSGVILAPNKELCRQIEQMAAELLDGLDQGEGAPRVKIGRSRQRRESRESRESTESRESRESRGTQLHPSLSAN